MILPTYGLEHVVLKEKKFDFMFMYSISGGPKPCPMVQLD